MFHVISKTLVEEVLPSAEIQSVVYSIVQADWAIFPAQSAGAVEYTGQN